MKESNGKSAFLFLCVFLSSYAIINGNTRIFVRQPPFDSFVCVTEQQYGYRRSRVMCSDACAQASGCIGFFYETVSGICNGTLVIHTNPSVCQFLNYGVGYYSDATIDPTTTSTTTTTTTPAPPTCPTSWIQFDNHCYWQDPVNRSWLDAEANCLALGGYMVSTESADEYTFIKSNFDGSIGWLGATDSAPDSIWRWDSGTAVLAFINWAPNEPDSSESNCDCMAVNVDAYNSWLWDDKNCDNMYRSICEKVL